MSKLRRPFVFTVSAALSLPVLAACEAPAPRAATAPSPSDGRGASTASDQASSSSSATSSSTSRPADPPGSASPGRPAVTTDADGGAATPGDATARLGDFPKSRNALDAKGRTIFRSSTDCWVELPWPEGKPRQPGEAPPTEPIACPEAMKTAAWDTCRGGAIYASTDGTSCICFKMGNPPPIPARNACPDDPKTSRALSPAHFRATAAMRMDGSVDGDALVAETNRLAESLARCADMVRGTNPTVGSLNLQVTVSANGKLNPDLQSPVNAEARRCITTTLRSWTVHGAGTGRAMLLLAIEQ